MKLSETCHNAAENISSIAPASDPHDEYTGSSAIDERIMGDYSHWSMPGTMEPAACRSWSDDILSGYYALRSALSGQGSFSIPHGWDVVVVHVLEIILRPDTPLKVVMAGVAKVASAEHLR